VVSNHFLAGDTNLMIGQTVHYYMSHEKGRLHVGLQSDVVVCVELDP